ncbi:MAG: hypothetical protein A3C43_01565 [Candidatus Schekmanbacteria bacterium RIFCSPHIGHO2_02_FULL_38_11]|uniref:SPOR domain-containing protein n=1 Tax=Candidatus Schekmanbacteria bacterium RIFCSPLOWO2_12_FULL_38_15 TaxID=1817883 RepID=A0A1F7SK39_9BACT|nr:MAG: hypothetical protein A2043_10080 [Candidatus Schekmanbacteria bacterium GWA2_38_9]OGL48300.1 MAG: hypothetical protein A3H37_00075 [Candidatus Schekmanbacteria bacterium RIFCSPLOWO2_02_FULL_38_14]OGL49946.1 MAG: hypothetical protein A3C43_01565 [Candidatus Schekmanbacteria bacterium RIFCSPHIGHO2_02_FULL_38_11]OGL54146.1 MAG: hypothetical protein A3G31_05115 [Candidatus Schekmanbacteria bacterium RIFCSPLOWO2_12_FULL_38_15]
MKESCYSIKVSAFTVEKFANSQYESLKKKGYDAYIEKEGGFAKKKTYTVMVGKFKTYKDTEKIAEIIREKERLRAEVVFKE